MKIDVLKNVLSEETFKKVQEETSKIEGNLVDLSKGGYVSNDKYTALETQLKSTQGLLDTKTKDFDDLKATAGDNKALQEQIDSLKSQHETDKAAITAQYEEMLKRNTVATQIMKDYKPKDVEDVIGHIDLSKVEIKDDSISGLSEQVDALKESKAYYFETDTDPSATGLEHNGGAETDVSAIRKAMGLKNE
ncbi:MAG: phage scaffolding protein [Clostridium sp.]|nr:phage scaffolding protein [Clostridium sp.]